MFQRIHDCLHRQKQALVLLCSLLEEEYRLLAEHDTAAIAMQEFSIQELIRQIAAEKMTVIHLLEGGKVMDYAALLPRQEQAAALRNLYTAIDRNEQQASRNASRNADLSLALLDQGQRLLQELSSRASAIPALTYGRKGTMHRQRQSEASLISGRL